ncbi:MAG: hypothetical protein ACU0BF_11360 [Paracoccaceae bacterium]
MPELRHLAAQADEHRRALRVSLSLIRSLTDGLTETMEGLRRGDPTALSRLRPKLSEIEGALKAAHDIERRARDWIDTADDTAARDDAALRAKIDRLLARIAQPG